MQKKQIIKNKVLNQIQFIKRHLSKQADFNPYNDFLIISLIAPQLPDSILAELILPLRSLNEELNSETEKNISMKPFLKILAKVEKKDHLLADFLNASGYDLVGPR